MNGSATIATLVCASALASLVAAEIRNDRRGRLMWKPLASAAFCAVPLFGGALDRSGLAHEVALWILAGLVLGAAGDIFLMFDGERSFLGGLVAFLLGHVAYVVAFARLVAPHHWIEGAMIAAPIAAAAIAGVVLRWLWPRLGAMRLPVIAYVAVITTMLVGGIAAAAHDHVLGARAGWLAAAGATAFFASDLAVAREKFVVRDSWNRVIGLPVYYGAQLLIAWSVTSS